MRHSLCGTYSLALAALTTVALLACGGDNSTGPTNVASVVVSPAADTLGPGETAQLTAQALDANGNVVQTTAVTWTSSATSVVAVSSTGVLTGVGLGTTTVTATIGGVSGSATVVVLQPLPNVAGTYQISGTFDNSPGSSFSGTLVLTQSGRFNPALGGDATVTLTSGGSSMTVSGLTDPVINADNSVSFYIGQVTAQNSWAFTGQQTASGLAGQQVLTNPGASFSGPWQAVR